MSSKTHMNLLPPSLRRRSLVREKLPFWAAAWAVVLTACGAVHQVESGRAASDRHLLAALRRQAQPVATLQADIASLRTELGTLAARQQRLDPLVDQRPLLLVLAHVSRAARQCQGELQIQSLEATRIEPRDDRPPEAAGSLALNGEADDYQSIMTFVTALRDIRAFTSVELESTSQRGAGRHAYQVRCTF